MRKIPARGLALLLLTSTVACHRPYALLQRTPTEHFTTKRVDARPGSSLVSVDSSLAQLPADTLPIEAIVPELVASAETHSLPQSTQSRVQSRLQQAHKLLTESTQQATDKQPRPKPKSQRKGMTLREFLGLPEKKPKTAWQRINWNIKAGIVLILIAVVFALLKITILAIIFGVLAALILLRGMRKTWKGGGFLGL